MTVGHRRAAAALTSIVALVALVTLAACTSSETAAPNASQTTSAPVASPTTSPADPARVSPRAQARALALQVRGLPLDITYRIKPSNPDQQGGFVRIQRAGGRYRVDVTRGGSTSSLRTAPRGLVSCLSSPNGRSCFLVARPGSRPPALFNPGVQRIVTQAVPALASNSRSLTVRRAGTWRAPFGYGQAVCFAVHGKHVDGGQYCLLDHGRFAGTPVKVTYRSGELVVRSIDRRVSSGFARPPITPTPLPNLPAQ
ncbi:MAG: hypothetical protein WAN48_08900 [Actinomycetes bacterium]